MIHWTRNKLTGRLNEGRPIFVYRQFKSRCGAQPDIRRLEIGTPALYAVGDLLIGEDEIAPQNVEAVVDQCAAGSERVWWTFDRSTKAGIAGCFREPGPLAARLGLSLILQSGKIEGFPHTL